MVKRRLTKRHTTTPAPSSTDPSSHPQQLPHQSSNGANRRLNITLPHLFRMHPWQRAHTFSESVSVPDFGEAVALEGFEWPHVVEEAKEEIELAMKQGIRELAHHIGNKILEDFDFDTSSSSSSSLSSSSDHDTESECSDMTLTAASTHEETATALSPPWWHYSPRRKGNMIFHKEEEQANDASASAVVPFPSSAASEAQSTSVSVLHESAGRWPDQDGEGFVF